MSWAYESLPNYNWNIIFRGKNKYEIELELKNLCYATDERGLEPTNPSVQQWSGGGDPNWPKERERIITERKRSMRQSALLTISRWIDNAVKYLDNNEITNEYKEQFPQIYNYLTDKNSIPYEKLNRIHYEIVQTITKCEGSKEVIEKRKKFEDKQKILAKKLIEDYKKKDYECNILFLEIEKNHMKSRELYEEYFTLKKLKQEYNKNNELFDIKRQTN